jgi:hypothetical protein
MEKLRRSTQSPRPAGAYAFAESSPGCCSGHVSLVVARKRRGRVSLCWRKRPAETPGGGGEKSLVGVIMARAAIAMMVARTDVKSGYTVCVAGRQAAGVSAAVVMRGAVSMRAMQGQGAAWRQSISGPWNAASSEPLPARSHALEPRVRRRAQCLARRRPFDHGGSTAWHSRHSGELRVRKRWTLSGTAEQPAVSR